MEVHRRTCDFDVVEDAASRGEHLPPQAGDPTRFFVVEFATTGQELPSGTDSKPGTFFKVVDIAESEGGAQERAKELARAHAGTKFGVYQKLGTAQEVRTVQWKGIRG